MPVLPFGDRRPALAPDVFVAEGAYIIGDVTIGAGSSVWYNAVIRGDIAPIRIGRGSNVQDGSVLHVDEGVPCVVGDGVVIGHGAVVHSATVEDGTMVAMHATLLSGSVVGRESIVGANALVSEGKAFPPRSLIVGVPGKILKDVTDEQVAAVRENARRYAGYAQAHKKALGGQAPAGQDAGPAPAGPAAVA
ncbi:MAG TPA: gamma carbonic anhydrase family protein [Chloroflexota bacterium]|nr:gamma carbonic anhydrase family protein [Chloroflexota bacterium]